MTEPDDVDGAWAGDDIPVPAPPSEFVAGPRRVAPDSPLVGSTVDSTAPTPTPRRARNVVVAVVAAGCALVASVLIVGGDDDPDVAEDPATTQVTQGTTERSSTTSTAAEPTATTDAPPVRSQRLALPAEVAAISEPTEVLMLASDGMLHTLSLPSGTVRSVPVVIDGSEVYPGQGLVVAPDAAALATGRGIVIVPRDAPGTVEVDPDNFEGEGVDVVGWRVAPDGATRFLVYSYGSSMQSASYEVGLDGEVIAVGDSSSDLGREYSTIRTDDGRAYVNDAGGVYEIAADGSAARVDEGVLRAVGSSTLLIRQCTPELACGDVLVDQETGQRQPIADGIVPDDMQFSGFGLDLAPDGSAVSAIVDSVNRQELALVDLTSGERLATELQSWGRGSRWAADSSGVFEPSATGTGVEFLSRAAGQVVHFADELERISALAVRRPASELAAESAVATVPIGFTGGAAPSPTGLSIVALTRAGNVVEVDVDARTADVWSAPSVIAVRQPALFHVDDRVAVLTNDSPDGETSGYLAVPGDQQALRPDLFGDGPILAGPSAGTVWTSAIPSSDAAIAGVQQVLIDVRTGEPAAPAQSIGVPGGVLLGGDGRGNLVVERGGDVYIASGDGALGDLRRLTSGELLAIGADTAYVRECDDASTCSVVRVDRLSGDRTATAEMLALLPAVAIDAADPPYGLVGSGVAPGGDLFVVPTIDGVLLVDGVNGPFTFVDDLDGSAAFVWSADGRNAVTMRGADLVLVGLDGVASIGGLGSLRALAAAPAVATD